MNTVSEGRRGGVLAVLAALCWGAAVVMSKASLNAFAPVSLLVIQLAASVGLLWTIVWIRRPTRCLWSEIAQFAWLGVLEPGLAYLLGLLGLDQTSASSATLIQASESILIVIASTILFRERPTVRFVALSLLALCSLAVALGVLTPGCPTPSTIYAELLVFSATATAALYVVLSGRIAAHRDAVYIVAWQQTVALFFAILTLPFANFLHGSGRSLPAHLGVWSVAVGSGLVQYALAFSLYMAALGRIRANVAGAYLTLTPVFAIAGAYVFLRESLLPIQAVGALATIGFVYLISREHHSETHQPVETDNIRSALRVKS